MDRAFSFLIIALLAAARAAIAAPTLSLSPASLPSEANATLTHTITGLAVGETVTIERFADINNNGAIDPGEPVLRTFTVTDGARPTIGGVVNANVAGDDDGIANGAIRVDLAFPGADVILNREPGKYVIRVTGASSAATAPFEITAPNLPQRVTGVLKNSSNNATISFGIIVVLVGDGDPIGSIRTDATGTFDFIAPAGDYVLVPTADGFAAPIQPATILANQTVTQNLNLNPGPVRVSGKLTDVATGAGLPGVFILAQNNSSQPPIISGGLTDSTGNYSFSVTPGSWEVRSMEEFTSQLGYVNEEQGPIVNAVAAPITQNLTVQKATSLIYGRVTDPSNNPVAGLAMRGRQNSPQNIESQGRTSASGDYFLGVTSDGWQVQSRGATILGFADENRDLTITLGTATRADIQLRGVTAHLRGRVVDARGNGISGIRFEGQIGNNFNTAASANTSGDGSFDLGVWAGDWVFQIGNDQDLGIIEHFVPLTIVDGVDQTLTYVVPDPTGHITGFVKDPSGQPMANLELSAETTINGVVYRSSTQTDASGNYSLPTLNGVLTFSFNCQDLDTFNYNCPGGTQVTVNNNTVTQNFNLTTRVTTQPQIDTPSLDQTGAAPVFHFNLRGDPGAYDILQSPGIPFAWTVVTTVAIPSGGNSIAVGFVPGVNQHFFKAQLRQ